MALNSFQWTRMDERYFSFVFKTDFTAVFTDTRITECAWKALDGQQPDCVRLSGEPL